MGKESQEPNCWFSVRSPKVCIIISIARWRKEWQRSLISHHDQPKAKDMQGEKLWEECKVQVISSTSATDNLASDLSPTLVWASLGLCHRPTCSSSSEKLTVGFSKHDFYFLCAPSDWRAQGKYVIHKILLWDHWHSQKTLMLTRTSQLKNQIKLPKLYSSERVLIKHDSEINHSPTNLQVQVFRTDSNWE